MYLLNQIKDMRIWSDNVWFYWGLNCLVYIIIRTPMVVTV